MTVFDGQALALEIEKTLQVRFKALPSLGLAIGLVGDDASSKTYVRLKQEMGERLGVTVRLEQFDNTITQSVLTDWIRFQNEDSTIQGILIQLPLPKSFSTFQVIESISPAKDVDGLHPLNWGKLLYGQPSVMSATVRAIWSFFEANQIEFLGKTVVIIGRGNLVGKPLFVTLVKTGATVVLCHKSTLDLAQKVRQADIVISAAGSPKLINGDMVKPGAVLVDVGDTRVDGQVVGDIDFDSVSQKASLITPVPGGIGPLTVVSLYANLLSLSEGR